VKAFKDEPEEIVPGLHQAIVTEELFDMVQDVCFNRRRIQAKTKKQVDELPLRGSLICSKCGKNLTGSSSIGNGGKYFYYHCQPGCRERYRADFAHNSLCQWLETITLKPEIASLYLAVMEDIYKTQGSDRKKEILQLERQLKDKKEMIVKGGLKVVNDEIDSDVFKQIKDQLTTESYKISRRISELKETDESFIEYSRFGFSLLSNLNNYYEQADLGTKQKLIGLIFPEKLYFTGIEYRTTKPSEILSLLFLTCNGLDGLEKKLPANNSEQSGKVAGARLELTTFGL
jgi:site-specific DNA recombinase